MTPYGRSYMRIKHWTRGSDDEERHLIFRDHLRCNDADRDAYAALKRSLAGHWRDVNYYAEAKGPFIQRTLDEARRATSTIPRCGR